MGETLSAIVSGPKKGRGKPALYLGLAGETPTAPPARISLAGIDRVDIGRGATRQATRSSAGGVDVLTLVLADARMSGQHARLSRLGGTWALEDLGSKNGTWIRGERITRQTLADGDVLVVGHTAIVYRDTGGEAGDTHELPRGVQPGFVTLSPALASAFEEVARAAKANVPIQITGESGTGKELVARAVHALSGRPGKFVAVNCGSLPPTLMEGELFGHKKGAYTGAEGERTGLVRSADGGTLFLDEIAELPAPSQAALLRVLQEGEVTPLGADKPVKVDLRVVTATHKDLEAEVSANRFRADLRARLLGVAVALPPLRERREDFGLLISTLLERLAPGRSVTFAADAVAALYTYDWPLNIRELERALAAALAVARDRIDLAHLPPQIREPRAANAAPKVDPSTLSDEDRQIRDALVAAIGKHGGNLAAVARDLGKDRTQIRRWMKRFGLSRDDED
ncbi:MAG TPA: sigma 54-interacting transcriptional regulator [Kofleriaceae bacterium]|nr:sigma 54-interacting transcriptional regulator [Kofleriaceae bacterium]